MSATDSIRRTLDLFTDANALLVEDVDGCTVALCPVNTETGVSWGGMTLMVARDDALAAVEAGVPMVARGDL